MEEGIHFSSQAWFSTTLNNQGSKLKVKNASKTLHSECYPVNLLSDQLKEFNSVDFLNGSFSRNTYY